MSAAKPAPLLRDFLVDLVPALVGAGLSPDDVRRVRDETVKEMGAGGTTREWVLATCRVLDRIYGDDEQVYGAAMSAVAMTLQRWQRPN